MLREKDRGGGVRAPEQGPCSLNDPGFPPGGAHYLMDLTATGSWSLGFFAPPPRFYPKFHPGRPPPLPGLGLVKGKSPTFASSLETQSSESVEQVTLGRPELLASRTEALPRNSYLRLRAGESQHRFIFL